MSSVDRGSLSHLGPWEPGKSKLHLSPGGWNMTKRTQLLKASAPRSDDSSCFHLQPIAHSRSHGQANSKQQSFHVTLPCPQKNYSIGEWHVGKMTFDLFEFTNNLVVDTGLEWRIKFFLICKSFKRIKWFNQTISISISNYILSLPQILCSYNVAQPRERDGASNSHRRWFCDILKCSVLFILHDLKQNMNNFNYLNSFLNYLEELN